MNEMVNLIPTCIVSNKKLFHDDSSQFWKTMYIHVEGGGGGGGWREGGWKGGGREGGGWGRDEEASWIVKRYEKYGRKVGWRAKWYGKYGKKARWIVKLYGKYGRFLC